MGDGSNRRLRAPTSKGYVRTTAALPENLHRRLMHASIESRLVATEIIRRAVGEWLVRFERKAKKGAKR
jgi:hypothetical protein